MNKTWLLSILIISLILLSILKSHELKCLTPFFKGEKVLRLKHFEDARKRVNKEDLENLKLWESILTGRSAPLSRLMKEKYQALGLNHLFTPSGFHLSAVLLPIMKLVKFKYHLILLLILGVSLCFLPGLTALKRMLLIKTNQKVLGLHLGFAVALCLDMLMGSFQTSVLSFTYSFLFLGIIYSGVESFGLVIWFFIGQMILAYFQNSDISLLILLFSPLLNLGFGILMPVLFCLSFPLWDWQLQLGLFLLKKLQNLVDLFSQLSLMIPAIELHFMVLVFLGLILFRKPKYALIVLIFLSSSLNLDRARSPGAATNEFVPMKSWVKTIYDEKHVTVYFKDGKCKMKLVRGFWWENCSPKRRSSGRKKIKKLSYPS